ncbi:hypothetical protein PoB_001614400 [Plakobranchus ocellatus]|uniref:Uncharacterized protein n=1 Tax=Plakobranchus ocellatus TaxID=259542 RepID=A0AAV3Z2T2_9GAST|nr:hypothetical protein PoB_001614400 [Plakobranchus ocellatus]
MENIWMHHEPFREIHSQAWLTPGNSSRPTTVTLSGMRVTFLEGVHDACAHVTSYEPVHGKITLITKLSARDATLKASITRPGFAREGVIWVRMSGHRVSGLTPSADRTGLAKLEVIQSPNGPPEDDEFVILALIKIEFMNVEEDMNI